MLLLLGWVVFAGCSKQRAQSITVSSAISLRPALEQIAANFQEQRPGDRVYLNFGASGSLRNQIIHGAPVDFFISAHQDEIDLLLEGQHIDNKTVTPIAYNRLAIVFSNHLLEDYGFITAEKAIREAGQSPLLLLSHPAIQKIAMGEPETVPVGRYAQEALKRAELWDETRTRLVFARNAHQLITYVEQGLVDAAWVYLSDAQKLPEPYREMIFEIPESFHSPITYLLTEVISDSAGETAAAFRAFVLSEQGASTLREYGFIAVHP